MSRTPRFINSWLRGLFVAALAGAVFLSCLTSVSALHEEESYEFLSYDVKTVVHKDHSYDIAAKFTVNIPNDMKHLAITIPTGRYRVNGIDVKGTKFHTEVSGNNYVVTIASPSALKKGEHTFLVTYRIQEYKDSNEARDIFYLNALPSEWSVPIGEFRCRLELPEDFPWDDLQYYAGQYSTQDVQEKLSYTVDKNVITMTGSKIPMNFGVTFKAELPNGYWQDPLDNNWTIQLAAFLMLVTVTAILLFWIIFGRDPRFSKKKLPHPIAGVSTADVGYLFNGRLRIRDIVSLLFYLGIKGNLRISEYEPKRYRLYRLKEPSLDEERYLRNLYSTLFEGVYEGRALEMEDLGPRLRQIKRNVEVSVASGYSSRDMRACTKSSQIMRTLSIALLSFSIGALAMLVDLHEYRELSYVTPTALTVLSFVTLSLIAGRFDIKYDMDRKHYRYSMSWFVFLYLLVLGYAVKLVYDCGGALLISLIIAGAGIASMFLICIMKARAKGNARLVNRLLGLKNFIDEAEPKDIARLHAADQDYYYEVLPYAFIFSRLEKWSKLFRWIRVPAADWFTSDISSRIGRGASRRNTIGQFTADLGTFARTIESEYNAMKRKRRLFG